ncbi:MAG: hypothetical protein IJ493_01300 [Clostridia bacterium]|nr:hypothetical protein [Clostridia bacterium]
MAEFDNALGIEIKYSENGIQCDASFRRVLSNRQILAWIMHDCLDEYKNCTIDEIAENYIESDPEVAEACVHPHGERISGLQNEDKLPGEGVVFYDIRFFASAPGASGLIKLIINVEAQQNFHPGYPLIKRGIYYCGRMLSAQYGTEFTEGRYGDLKKVCSIWICSSPPVGRENTITRYELHEEQVVGQFHEKPENYDMLSVVMVCLGRDPEQAEGVLKLLRMMLSKNIEQQLKMQRMQDEFGITMTEQLESEVSLMCNVSQGYYLEGVEKGIAKGMAKGEVLGKREMILSMLEDGSFGYDVIARLAKLPVTDIEQIDRERLAKADK